MTRRDVAVLLLASGAVVACACAVWWYGSPEWHALAARLTGRTR